MTFFSSEAGEFLDALQLDRGRGGTTMSKLKLYALIHHDGDVPAAREALGIDAPTRVEVSAPPLATIADLPTIRLEDIPVDQLPNVDWEELGLPVPPQLLRHPAQQAAIAASFFAAYHPDLAAEVSAHQINLWEFIRAYPGLYAPTLAAYTGDDESTISWGLTALQFKHPRPLVICHDGGWHALDADGRHACGGELARW
jgi:hypothetical protein